LASSSETGLEIFYKRFLEQVKLRYPEATRALALEARLSPLLFCPDVLELPRTLRVEAEAIVRAFFKLRLQPDRAARLAAENPKVVDGGNFSALMSYDFHVDENGRLRLIEINTNASMSLLAELLYELHGLENPFSAEFRLAIMKTFKTEYSLSQPGGSLRTVVITDHEPERQRLYAEFELYRELFLREGFNCSISDATDLMFHNGELRSRNDEKIDLVYNRHTDFYLETPSTTGLRAAMTEKAACLSPHPFEYRMLADKERLLELNKPGALDALAPEIAATISRALIQTLDVAAMENAEALWADRKKWFFKPKRSFGGKATFRGSSMTRGAFKQVLESGSHMAQEFVAAPVVTLPTTNDEYKYDLRFFVYRDQIQLACARLYKGQMTNSQTPGGGIAPIRWL
jgi:hypothetical protein